MNKNKILPYLSFIIGLFLLVTLIIVYSIINSYWIVYTYGFNIAHSLFLILFGISIILIQHGILEIINFKKGRDMLKLSKKYYYFIGIFSLTIVLLASFFAINFIIFDFFAIHDDAGNLLTNLILTLLVLGILYFGIIGYHSFRIQLALTNGNNPDKKIKRAKLRTTRQPYEYFRLKRIETYGLIFMIGCSGLVSLSTYIFFPDCYWGFMGFSDPAYDLPSDPRYNSNLNGLSGENKTILEALEKGLRALTTIRQKGGFPMWVETDGSHFYSDRGMDCPLFPGEFSLQEGTALLAGLFLKMYDLEPNPNYLKVAQDAGDALIAVQDEENGGFYYDGRRYDDGLGYQPHPKNLKRSTILDDNVMQSCLDFLLDLYNVTKKDKYKNAFKNGFDCLKEIEKPQGGWPQRSNYPDNCYCSYVTLNDNTFRDVVLVLIKADLIFPSNSKYINMAKRACNLLIDLQGNGGSKDQKAWAQQYDDNDQPAWARDFEPPGMCSMATKSAMEALLEMYLATNNSKWLDPIPKAIEWLESDDTMISWVEDGEKKEGWARIYELKTNKPIYGYDMGRGKLKEYSYDYEDNLHQGYGWVDTYGIPEFIDRYELLVSKNYNITKFKEAEANATTIPSTRVVALSAVDDQIRDGFWLNEGKIRAGTCADAITKLISYLKLAFT